MKLKHVTIFLVVAALFVFYMATLPTQPTKPSDLLHFPPVCEGSDPNDVRIAQAELCRHGIDVKIDGDFGKQTAMGVCELLVRIENGYQVRSIYDRRPGE